MSEKRLIDWNEFKRHCPDSICCSYYENGPCLPKTCKYWQALPKPPSNEWIKIEGDKDLPKDEKSVLGWSPNELGRCVVSWNTYFKQWNYHDYRIPKESITHWEPLPEPPKD